MENDLIILKKLKSSNKTTMSSRKPTTDHQKEIKWVLKNKKYIHSCFSYIGFQHIEEMEIL